MFPYLGVLGIQIHVNTALIFLCLLSGMAVMLAVFQRSEGYFKPLLTVFAVTIAALLGSRILHVLWERPLYFREASREILSNLGWMVLYGGIALASLTLYSMSFLYRRENRGLLWD